LLSSCIFFVKRPLHKTDDRFYSQRLRGFIELVEVLQHRRPPSRTTLQSLGQSVVHSPTILGLMSKALKAKAAGKSQYGLQMQSETAPNPESRVTLIDSKDALGVNQIRLDWRLSSQDLDSFRRSQDCLLAGLTRLGLSIRELHHDRDPEGWPLSMLTSKHHMGTTRMNQAPGLGVVDENCRVHGVPNLYIAGSSVFPTSGMANPTLTIVALAVRLADRIKQVLS
jgi:choline dehydrogenase-like flavoprotein